MRIAVLGAGSLGTIVGAQITKNGGDVTLIDEYDEHVRVLNLKGATVVGKMEMNIPVKACTLEQISGKFDIVLYLAKGPNNFKYLSAILPHLHENSLVCTLQNGVPEEAVAQYIGKERVIGGTVGWGASLKEPGVSEMTSDQAKQTYEIGEIDGSITPRVETVKKILDMAGSCDISDNLMAIRWTKLAVNASFSGMSAALGCTYGDVLDNEKTLLCAAFVKDELIKVAHAQGIKLVCLQGQEFEDYKLINGIDSFENVKPFYHKWYTPHRKVIASMLFDLKLGRKTEIEDINGVVTYKGDQLGIDTPFNDKVVEVVKEAEVKKQVTTMSNLEKFEDIIQKLR